MLLAVLQTGSEGWSTAAAGARDAAAAAYIFCRALELEAARDLGFFFWRESVIGHLHLQNKAEG